MHDHIVRFVELEVRDIERPQRLDRLAHGLLGVAAAGRGSKVVSHPAQRAQPARAIEALPLTVFAKRHGLTLVGGMKPVNGLSQVHQDPRDRNGARIGRFPATLTARPLASTRLGLRTPDPVLTRTTTVCSWWHCSSAAGR